MSKKYGTRTAFHSNFGSISYEELWHQSGRIAQALEEELGDDKHPVVVYGHKRPEMLVGFLACVRSGRAYCPVDVNMPADMYTSSFANLILNTDSYKASHWLQYPPNTEYVSFYVEARKS